LQTRDDDMAVAQARLQSFAAVEFVRRDGTEWLRAQPAGSLAFGYIDSDHTYPTTDAQIRALWDALQPGGIMGLHDYDPFFYGVCQAAEEFEQREQVEVFVIRDRQRLMQWSCYAVKGGA
jgi:hypothetical protein